jgi:hypothetical protein
MNLLLTAMIPACSSQYVISKQAQWTGAAFCWMFWLSSHLLTAFGLRTLRASKAPATGAMKAR